MLILIGVLYIVVGCMIMDEPIINMVLITKFIAIFLVVAGAFRIISALVMRFQDWGWALLNGGITLLLGIIIHRQLPEAALWVIGLFIGIELLFNGWAWVMLGLGLRALAKRSSERSENRASFSSNKPVAGQAHEMCLGAQIRDGRSLLARARFGSKSEERATGDAMH